MFRKFLIKFLKSERISNEFKLQKTNLQNKSFNGNQRELPLNEGLCARLQLNLENSLQNFTDFWPMFTFYTP